MILAPNIPKSLIVGHKLKAVPWSQKCHYLLWLKYSWRSERGSKTVADRFNGPRNVPRSQKNVIISIGIKYSWRSEKGSKTVAHRLNGLGDIHKSKKAIISIGPKYACKTARGSSTVSDRLNELEDIPRSQKWNFYQRHHLFLKVWERVKKTGAGRFNGLGDVLRSQKYHYLHWTKYAWKSV
jgi:hypothetical protein